MGDTACGSGANLDWLVNEAKIAPHIPVVDKSKREDGTFSGGLHIRQGTPYEEARDVARALAKTEPSEVLRDCC